MASPLTWRNVEGPDFRGALAGFQTSGNLLSNAAEGWNKQLAYFGEQDRDAAAVAESAMRQRAGAENLSQTQYTNARTRDTNQLTDNATPMIAEFLTRMNRGDTAGAQELFGSSPELRNLRPEQMVGMLNDGGTIQGRTLTNTGQNIRNEGNALDNTKAQLDYQNQVQKQADAAVVQNIQTRLNTDTASPEARMRKLMGLRDSVSPSQWEQLVAANSSLFGSTGSTSAAATSPGASAIAGAATTSTPLSVDATKGYNTAVGNVATPKPLTTMTNDELIKYGRDVLIPGNRGNAKLGLPADKGSSAAGAFQITGETLEQYGPKALGDNWRTQPFSEANQNKIAEVIFNDRKSGDLTKTWKGLEKPGDKSNQTPGYYKDKTWNDVRKDIAKSEVGVDIGDSPVAPTTAAGTVRAANFELKNTQSDQSNAGIVADVNAALSKTNTLREVANAGREKGGDFEGWSEKRAMTELGKAMKVAETNNPSVAAALLRRSLEAPTTDPDALYGLATHIPFVDTQVNVNSALLKANIEQWKNGGTSRGVSALEDTKEFAAKIPVAEEKSKADTALAKALEEQVANGRTGVRDEATAARTKANEAAVALQDLMKKAASQPSLQSDRATQQAAREALAKQQATQQAEQDRLEAERLAKRVPVATTVGNAVIGGAKGYNDWMKQGVKPLF